MFRAVFVLDVLGFRCFGVLISLDVLGFRCFGMFINLDVLGLDVLFLDVLSFRPFLL
jgi:hypothetical protein